jgi:peptidoglycan/LPS O-acetylase OafA/YrhL
MNQYRAEVDGLRAIAVIPVILFHAGLQILPGGFLGVDVFFVISGYLISRILFHDFEAGRFSLVSFYERRARRIMPALFVVVIITFPLAYQLSPPDAFAGYLSSIRATSLFFSNIHFWQSIGYFNPAAAEQPLLHTWSLGVEEQFYILFPLLFWLVLRFARSYCLPIFLALALAGFVVCVFQVSWNRDVAFFWLHARAWELFAGVIVTLLESRTLLTLWRGEIKGNMLAALGLILAIASFFVVSEVDEVPGWPTIMPVLGTALVLMFANTNNFPGRILAVKPIVALGLISYSAYLWHHPLFAFARLYFFNAPQPFIMAGLTVVALLLATLTYHFVEKPFRNHTRVSQRAVFRLAPAAILALFVLVSVGNQYNWAQTRFDSEKLARVFPTLYKTGNCNWTEPVPLDKLIRFCRIGAVAESNPVVIWGDSHAQALVGELNNALAARKFSGIYVDSTKCLRLPGVYTFNSKIAREAVDCAEQQDLAFRAIADLKPRAFIVSMRWTMRLFPLPGAGETVGFNNGEGGVEVEDKRTLAALGADGKWDTGIDAKSIAVATFFKRLVEVAPLIVIGPVPEVGWHVGNQNFKAMILRGAKAPDISTSSALFRERNAAAMRILEQASVDQRITRIEPSELFCDTMIPGRCVAQRDGIAYYADDDHLSQTGADMVVEQIVKALPQP